MDREFLWAAIPGGVLVIMMISNGGWGALSHPILLVSFIALIVAAFMIFGSESDDTSFTAEDSDNKVIQVENISSENECTRALNNKGYDVLKTDKGFTVYIKPIIMDSIKGRASNVEELCGLADKYNQIDY
jgi:hypothetical protein